jgi:predicted acyltransferase
MPHVKQILRSPADRVAAVDVLRGMAIGMVIVEVAMHQVWTAPPSGAWLAYAQQMLTHAEWHGFHLADFGFPGFVLLMGISLRLANHRDSAIGTDSVMQVKRIIARAGLLFLIGFFQSGAFIADWPKIPVAGVLQRLSICYLTSGIALQFLGARSRCLLATATLLGYWALLAFVSVPGHGAGNFSPEGNLVRYIDQLFLPGRVMRNGWHPEGILGSLGAASTCLFGTLLGDLLVAKLPARDKPIILAVLGLSLIPAALLWHDYLPINKRMWTPSFVLISVGWGCILLSVVYQFTEVWKHTLWANVLIRLGRHPLFAYVVLPLIRLDVIAERLIGGNIGKQFGQWQTLAEATVQVGCGVAIILWFDRINTVDGDKPLDSADRPAPSQRSTPKRVESSAERYEGATTYKSEDG